MFCSSSITFILLSSFVFFCVFFFKFKTYIDAETLYIFLTFMMLNNSINVVVFFSNEKFQMTQLRFVSDFVIDSIGKKHSIKYYVWTSLDPTSIFVGCWLIRTYVWHMQLNFTRLHHCDAISQIIKEWMKKKKQPSHHTGMPHNSNNSIHDDDTKIAIVYYCSIRRRAKHT